MLLRMCHPGAGPGSWGFKRWARNPFLDYSYAAVVAVARFIAIPSLASAGVAISCVLVGTGFGAMDDLHGVALRCGHADQGRLALANFELQQRSVDVALEHLDEVSRTQRACPDKGRRPMRGAS
jgi:hypothetical protein